MFILAPLAGTYLETCDERGWNAALKFICGSGTGWYQSCRPLIASASNERRSCFSPLNLAAPPPTVSAIYISTQQLFLLPGDRFSFCPPDIRWRWPLGGGAVQWAKKPAHRSRLALSLQLERRSRAPLEFTPFSATLDDTTSSPGKPTTREIRFFKTWMGSHYSSKNVIRFL